MLWKRILVGVVAAVFFSGMFTVLAHQSLVQMLGKHVGSVKYGRSLTEQRYAVDPKAKRRIRRGTLIFFLVVAALVFACAWSTILLPEQFGKFFPNP